MIWSPCWRKPACCKTGGILSCDRQTATTSTWLPTTRQQRTRTAGTVILSGLVELMESDFDRVMAAGLARLNFEHEKQIIEESTSNGANVETFPGTNIVKIDFGKKQ